jgi:hypothetical protein
MAPPMPTLLSERLDSLAEWRQALDRRIEQFERTLADLDLLTADDAALASALRQRLATDRLVVAFVAEFSRGKSELINALFFGDSGRRLMPAAPGRTTMCPVEIGWTPGEMPMLSLLPIDSRLNGQPLSVLRERPEGWRRLPLPLGDPAGLARVLEEVMHTLRVSIDEARALGFWNDERPDDNPPRDEDDRVEVPAWRHALINHPHPLLRRGLVVVDTPGLNAIGAEPELTLGLLPAAHATVFVLAADAGVSRSDLAVWRDHLDDRACEHFVVLNKIDTLADPLLDPAQIEAQIERQCAEVARTLGVERGRIFPLSAREALAARVQGDAAALERSRLPAFEQALTSQLLPRRSEVIGRMVEDGMLLLLQRARARLDDRRRQTAEQLIELRGLRGKDESRLRLAGERVDRELVEFEQSAPRLAALRAVMARQLRAATQHLTTERIREEVARMHAESASSVLKLGAGRAFALLGERLQGLVEAAERDAADLGRLYGDAQRQVNAEFGLALSVSAPPQLEPFKRELAGLQEGYGRYFGVMQVWRLSQRGFLQQLLRMLRSRLQVVFENAAVEIETWGKAVIAQLDDQLRERRRSLVQRREGLQRVRAAETDLQRSIDELQAQEERWRNQAERLQAQVDAARQLAASPPAGLAEPAEAAPRLSLVRGGAEAVIGVA